jgi:hypothetical protein
MNNQKLFNPTWLRAGVEVIREINKELATVIGINQACVFTDVSPTP